MFFKKEANLDTIKHLLIIFFAKHGINRDDLHVVDVKKKETRKYIRIYITLEYPEKLNGYIDQLVKYVSGFFKKEIDVIFFELKIWDVDYQNVKV